MKNLFTLKTSGGVLLALLFVALSVFLVSCGKNTPDAKPADVDYYTCTMHPSVRSQDPHGKCPICSMDLVPVMKKGIDAKAPAESMAMHEEKAAGPTSFTVPLDRQQQIGVTYGTVGLQPFRTTVRALGVVAADRELRWEYAARVDGYAQKLGVYSPGQKVEKGAPLLTLYSPALFTAEKELLDAVKMHASAGASGFAEAAASAEQLTEAGRERLRLWNFSDEQVAALLKTGQAKDEMDLLSPFAGVVQEIGVEQGRHINVGDRVVSVVGLGTVWVWAQFYQEDLPLLKTGTPVTISLPSAPEKKWDGKIAAIDPVVDAVTRTVRVRIDVPNQDLRLLPEMYVDAELNLDLGTGLAIPASAIMPTGLHNIAFVDRGGGKLEPRSVELGRRFGDFYEVKGGVKESERVVTSANFLVDAEAKVQDALKSW